MKISTYGFLAFSAVTMLATVGCGSKSSGSSTTNGDGGAGGAGATSGTQSSAAVNPTQSGPSSGSGGGGTGGSAACGILWDDRADCETCMESSCCTQMEACAPGSDCDQLLSCADACKDDSACVQACVKAHATGLTDFQAVQTCYDDKCQTDQACEYAICDSGLVYPDKDCAACLGTNCCDADKACIADAACKACLADSTGTGCDTNTLLKAATSCENGTKCGPTCTSSICGSQLGYPNQQACNYCLSQSCCTEFNACEGDTACDACLKSSSATGCDTNTSFKAFTACRDTGACKTDCGN